MFVYFVECVTVLMLVISVIITVLCSRCAKVLPLALSVYQDGLPLHYVYAVHAAKVI